MLFARAIRVLCAGLATSLALFAVFLVWHAVADYAMQVREHWRYRCGDVIIPSIFFAWVSAALATLSALGYRKSTAWERRLHATP